jgi:VCBS repeat-containing protein
LSTEILTTPEHHRMAYKISEGLHRQLSIHLSLSDNLDNLESDGRNEAIAEALQAAANSIYIGEVTGEIDTVHIQLDGNNDQAVIVFDMVPDGDEHMPAMAQAEEMWDR